MILNVISLHSYDEVKLVLVTSPKQEAAFEPFKNVPHIWSNDKKIRFFATNPDEVHFISMLLMKRSRNVKKPGIRRKNDPAFCGDRYRAEAYRKEALLRYVNDADNQVGITTLFAYGDIAKLPKSCKTIIQSDDTRTGYYIKNKNANRFIPFALDNVEPDRICSFANELSRLPIKRDSRSMGIADRISFLQMYKVGNVKELGIESHWENKQLG